MSTAKYFRKVGTSLLASYRGFCKQVGLPIQEVGDNSVISLLLYGFLSPDIQAFTQRSPDFLRICHWATRWAEQSFPTMQLTHGLAASLLLTECRGTTGRDFKMPFSSVLIEMPWPNEMIALLDQRDGSTQYVRWIALQRLLVPASDEDAARLQRSQVDPRNHPTVESMKQSLAEFSKIQWSEYLVLRLFGDNGVQAWSRSTWPPDAYSLEQWVANNGNEAREVDHARMELTDYDGTAIKLAARLVANCFLWLESKRTDQDRQHNRAMPTGIQKSGLTKSWKLGQGIKLALPMRDAANHLQQRGGKALWRVHDRFIVRGHWKRQPCGEGRRDRKVLWIEPYWKGPKEGIPLDKLYQLSGQSA